MNFLWPRMLYLLAAIPLLVLLYLRIQARRRRLAAAYGGLGTAAHQGGGGGLAWRRHVPPALFLAALTVLALGLARPQAEVSVPRLEGTVVLAFDVSGSMSADDLQPTRLEAAKAAAREFVRSQPLTVQIGVVSFSESGFSVQPPTSDQEAILAAIARLTPTRGTSLASGIYTALTAIALSSSSPPPRYYSNRTPMPTPSPTPVPAGTYTPAAIVLLSDGENTANPDPLGAAQAAAARGVRVYTIGIGSPEGTIVHVSGFMVHSRLEEAPLKQIAQLTGGAYYPAGSVQELEAVYADLGRQMVVRPEETEITALFAGLGILTLLLGAAFSLLWFSRLP